jgi:hypothetical protein
MTTPATPAAPARPELDTQFVPLARGIWHLAEYLTIPETPAGTRVIVEITQGRLEGDRFKAALKGAASADWFTIGPGGIGTVDFRGTLETDDGALIYLHGPGRCDLSGGMNSQAPLYGGALFETSDKRYKWLNSIAGAWKGVVIDGIMFDEYFELR